MPNELMKTLTIGANTYDLPQKTSDLTNDSGFITSATLWVTLTYDDVNDTYTADHTYTEIDSAINAGKNVLVNLDNGEYILSLYGIYNSVYSFRSADVFVDGFSASITGTSAEVNEDNSWLVTDGSRVVGTVESVRVQATSPVQSSTNTTQSVTLNTTISLADGYGDTKNPYASKTKNYVLAAPSSANGTPSFRALVADDIPSLTKSKISDFPSIPTKTSDLTNDSGYLTSAVTSFNGSTGAVTYTAPVTSVNGSTGAVTLSIPTKASDIGAVPRQATAGGGESVSTIGNNATSISISQGSSVGSSSLNLTDTTISLLPQSYISNFHASITMSTHAYGASAATNNIVLSDGTTTIIGVVTPTSDGMAANKKYVDDSITAAIGTAIGGSY